VTAPSGIGPVGRRRGGLTSRNCLVEVLSSWIVLSRREHQFGLWTSGREVLRQYRKIYCEPLPFARNSVVTATHTTRVYSLEATAS
jgi:hypothetical protein